MALARLFVVRSISNAGAKKRRNFYSEQHAVDHANELLDWGHPYVHVFQTADTREEYRTVLKVDDIGHDH